MHIYYHDILKRIPEAPRWWLNGVPRFDAFTPHDLNVYAREALLVHVRCQGCETDFHIGIFDPAIAQARSFRARLTSHRTIGIGDPPNSACCPAGPTMSVDEVAVLEFWERSDSIWKRVPELERGLWESDIEIAENHAEAWRRIHIYDRREPGNRPSWSPPSIGFEFPDELPKPLIIPSSETGKFIDLPGLNQRRRLALMALKGKISQDEYQELAEADQRTFRDYEVRANGQRPDWAIPLADEMRNIDEIVIANAVPGYTSQSPSEREVSYCHGLKYRLAPLAQSGRITHEEYREVFALMMRTRFTP